MQSFLQNKGKVTIPRAKPVSLFNAAVYLLFFGRGNNLNFKYSGSYTAVIHYDNRRGKCETAFTRLPNGNQELLASFHMRTEIKSDE